MSLPGVPMIASALLSCAAQPISTLSVGVYTSGSFSEFSTCDAAYFPSGSTSAWYIGADFVTTTYKSYSYFAVPNGGSPISGQGNTDVDCAGSVFGTSVPTIRFTADQAYTALMYTASYCLSAACSTATVAAEVSAGESLVHAFPVNTAGQPDGTCSFASLHTFSSTTGLCPRAI